MLGRRRPEESLRRSANHNILGGIFAHFSSKCGEVPDRCISASLILLRKSKCPSFQLDLWNPGTRVYGVVLSVARPQSLSCDMSHILNVARLEVRTRRESAAVSSRRHPLRVSRRARPSKWTSLVNFLMRSPPLFEKSSTTIRNVNDSTQSHSSVRWAAFARS
jgi:hypothetical protein